MHITYEFHKFMSNIDMSNNKNAQSSLKAVEQRINDLKAEEETIIKICIQLTRFIVVNALYPICDDSLQYIQHFIREELIKKNAGDDNDGVINGLEKLLADYTREMEILRKEMVNDQKTANLFDWTNVSSREDIFHLVDALYYLPINGKKIQAQVEELKHVQHRFSEKGEEIVNLPAEANSSRLMTDLINILKEQ